jgi:hypothetical protein
MFLAITVTLKLTQFTYQTDRQAVIVLESDLDTLSGMCYGAGETVSEAMSSLIDAEQKAQQRLLAEAETVEEE